MQKIKIAAADGYQLGAIYGRPVGESIGSIILSSATGIRKEFYISFAYYLIQNGYSVLLFDYRGIGESAPDDLKTSHSYMHEWGALDMNAALDYMVNEKGLTDIIWVGHSVGGQLIGFIRNHHHIRKVIAISAAFGYWKYLPSPVKWKIWSLWFFAGPLMVWAFGYGAMKKIGWGENLSRNMMKEWREWCLSKTYFSGMLQRQINMDKFYGFNVPITSVYMSDDYLANDKTAPLMLTFFPNTRTKLIKLDVEQYTAQKVGHVGIFRKKFMNSLWIKLIEIMEEEIPAAGTVKLVKEKSFC